MALVKEADVGGNSGDWKIWFGKFTTCGFDAQPASVLSNSTTVGLSESLGYINGM
jgi:hypothetical protein